MNKSSNKIIIAFEGVDGVGKTTLATKLAELNNYFYIKCPFEDAADVKNFYEVRFNQYPSSRFFYYLSSVWEVYSYIINNNSHQIFLVDRYILSTRIYHKVLFKKLNLIEEYQNLICSSPFPPEPFLNIVFTADRKTRLERIKNRRKKCLTTDIFIEDDQNLLDEVQNEYLMQNNICVIDTTNKSIEEILAKCDKQIKNALINIVISL